MASWGVTGTFPEGPSWIVLTCAKAALAGRSWGQREFTALCGVEINTI